MFTAEHERVLRALQEYHCPRYEEFPSIPLYSDQVVDLLSRYTAPFFPAGVEQALTPAMINNYVRQRLLPPPVKKRYERDQVVRLFCICLLKHMFSFPEIRFIMTARPQDVSFADTYNYFCVELEKALRATFSTRDFSAPSSAPAVTLGSELIRSAALCFANRIFTAKLLEFAQQDPELARLAAKGFQ